MPSQLPTHLLQTLAYQKGINYDLSNFQKTLASFGNPHHSLNNIIHIAGTNGKGSTLTFIAAALQDLGYTVGTYTSPHIHSYCERIQINNSPISTPNFKRLCTDAISCVSSLSTEFEVLTLMAFLYFQEKNPDYCIIETGLGGRLDATNVVSPILSIITKIGLDHEAILGNTIEEIAAEKAGILKPPIPALTIQQNPNVLAVLKKAHPNLQIIPALSTLPKNLHMQGLYQKENLALAQAALNHLLPNTKPNFQKAHIWGRFERKEINGQTWIIDAAHNPDGIDALIQTLTHHYPNQKFTFVTSILQTKNAGEILSRLAPHALAIYYCCFDPQIAHSYQEIQTRVPHLKIQEIDVQEIQKIPTKNPVLTGSIYFISHVTLYLIS
ncbi:MAG: hypothetical protein EXS67_03325 [Candidatus Margulisbacteria bacterium]|nr:hypothetical protein [Candidatus Margulisiibacteriota bacterium]